MLRGKSTIHEGYTESHHIIPKCLGGTDDHENLVRLTPEEHYLAHQLLVKMHPGHLGLAYAAMRMTHNNGRNKRSNKLYGWLRREYSLRKTGRKNSPGHVAKVAAKHRGMKRPPETGMKIAASKLGKNRTMEAREAISLGLQKLWVDASDAKKAEWNDKKRVGRENMSEEAKLARRQALREKTLAFWKNMTPEQKAARAAKTKQTKASRKLK